MSESVDFQFVKVYFRRLCCEVQVITGIFLVFGPRAIALANTRCRENYALIAADKNSEPRPTQRRVPVESVIREHDRQMALLRKLGVQFRETNRATQLQRMIDRGEIILEGDTNRPESRGRVLEILGFDRPPSRTSPYARALQHRELQNYIQTMQAAGYQFGVDTSLPSAKVKGVHFAFFLPDGRQINRELTISAAANWLTLRHEFQHFEFSEWIRPNWLVLREAHAAGKSLAEALPADLVQKIGKERLARIESLFANGVQRERTVNEVLSRDEELRALGWRRYSPYGSGPRIAAQALTEQIKELEGLGSKATSEQLEILNALKLEAGRNVIGQLGLAIAIPGAAGAVVYGFHQLYLRYTDILHDDKGNMIGRRADGTFEFLRRL